MSKSIALIGDLRSQYLQLENENKRLRRSLEELSILNDLASAIGGLGSSQSILTKIVGYSITAVDAEQGVITLTGDDAENRRKTAVRVVDKSVEGAFLHLHESLLVWMFRNKQPLLMNDPHHDKRFPEAQWDDSVRSVLAVPLMIQGGMIGVLKVYNKKDPGGFTPDDQRLLSIVGSQSAQVIEHARLTEREHKATIEHIEKEQELREEFAERLIAMGDQERKRIAAELHDSIGQNLLVIKNRAYLALESCTEDHPASRELELISSISMQTIDEVREIAHDLHPYKLERLGLTKAIRSIIDHAGESSSIAVLSHIEPVDGLVAKDAEIHIYRIVQEGLNNIVRHSHAKTLRVTVSKAHAGVAISLQDDGCGFDLAEMKQTANKVPGLGLLGMEERVRICGGVFAISSTPGKGTAVTFSVPYERKCNG